MPSKHSIILSFLFAFVACNDKGLEPISPNVPFVPHTLNEAFQGTWHNTNSSASLKYMVFDTVANSHSEKWDYGFNFRSELSYPSKLDSQRIRWQFYDGSTSTRWWISFSADTLTISDSLGSFVNRFVRQSLDVQLSNWVERLVWMNGYHYPQITQRGKALAYSDSGWFMLASTDTTGKNRIYRINPSSGLYTSVNFSNTHALDVVGSDLWLAGRYFVERRRIPDLTLLDHYDLLSYFLPGGATQWIRALAVSDSTIYLATADFSGSQPVGKMFILKTNGQVVETRDCYFDLDDLAVANGHLFATNLSGYFYELDINSMIATHTYYLVQQNLLNYHGIAMKDGTLACADFVQNYLRIFDFSPP